MFNVRDSYVLISKKKKVNLYSFDIIDKYVNIKLVDFE